MYLFTNLLTLRSVETRFKSSQGISYTKSSLHKLSIIPEVYKHFHTSLIYVTVAVCMYFTADIAENLIIQNHSQSSLLQLCSKQNVKQKL